MVLFKILHFTFFTLHFFINITWFFAYSQAGAYIIQCMLWWRLLITTLHDLCNFLLWSFSYCAQNNYYTFENSFKDACEPENAIDYIVTKSNECKVFFKLLCLPFIVECTKDSSEQIWPILQCVQMSRRLVMEESLFCIQIQSIFLIKNHTKVSTISVPSHAQFFYRSLEKGFFEILKVLFQFI